MSTGDRCSRCSECSCSRCSENGTGDSESLKSSLFCTCIEQPATATPATAATPRKGQRPALQPIGSQQRTQRRRSHCGQSKGGTLYRPAAAGRKKTRTGRGAWWSGYRSLGLARSADAVELAPAIELAAHIAFVPAVGRRNRLGFLERSGRVRVQPRPHGSAHPASLRTLDPVAFFLHHLRGWRGLAGCGRLLHWCRAFLPAESDLVTVLMNGQGDPFARDASSYTSAAGVLSAGVGLGRLLHVVLLCVIDDRAITGCVSEKRQAIGPATKEQQIPYLTGCARKRLELFHFLPDGRHHVSPLHVSRRTCVLSMRCDSTCYTEPKTLQVLLLTESNARCSAYRVRPSYHALMATNAQHQASYRARQATAGSVRLDTHISADAHAALAKLTDELESDFSDWKEARYFAQQSGATPDGFASQMNDALVRRVIDSIAMSKVRTANISKELSRISVFQ